MAAAPNAATSTYDAKVTLENPPQDVVVGMTAQVKFTDPDSARGFMVPLSAHGFPAGLSFRLGYP